MKSIEHGAAEDSAQLVLPLLGQSTVISLISAHALQN